MREGKGRGNKEYVKRFLRFHIEMKIYHKFWEEVLATACVTAVGHNCTKISTGRPNVYSYTGYMIRHLPDGNMEF
jgi:hypothetical protein